MALHFPAVIDLNVGGRHLTTSLSTLTKYPDSMLAAMFSGRQPVIQDKDGRYFIDVDGDVFVHVLNFLRFETMPPPEAAAEVRKYADYFGLHVLMEGIPRIQDNREALYDIWRRNCLSKVTNYAGYWEGLKRRLKEFKFAYRYACVTTRMKPCRCYPDKCDLIITKCEMIALHFDEHEEYTRRSVLNFLAHDMQRLGVFILERDFPEIIDLNVGGRYLSTRLSTLTKYPGSKLADIFSGKYAIPQDKDGRFFIDADGDVFVHILNFLRYEVLPPPEQAIVVHKYANIFGIEQLSSKLLKWGPVLKQALTDKWKREIDGYDDCVNQVREGLIASRYQRGHLYIQFTDSSQHIFSSCKVAGVPEGHEVINVKYSSNKTDGSSLVTFLNNDLKRMGVHLQPGDFRPEPKCGCRVVLHYMIKSE